jgi:probable rRNA maturation factor
VNDGGHLAGRVNGMVLEVVVGPADSVEPETRDIIRRAILAADAVAGPTRGTVSVLVEGDAAIRELNRIWRGIDKPTNVLAFPPPQAPPRRHVGDIAISYETAAREAGLEAKPLAHHLAHLAVHGFLHLLGHDHQSDAAAEEMEHLERKILARLDIPDPYGP